MLKILKVHKKKLPEVRSEFNKAPVFKVNYKDWLYFPYDANKQLKNKNF